MMTMTTPDPSMLDDPYISPRYYSGSKGNDGFDASDLFGSLEMMLLARKLVSSSLD